MYRRRRRSRRNPICTCHACPVHGAGGISVLHRRRNPATARRLELQAASPGNYRRPTLAVTKDYLDDWSALGVTSEDDMKLSERGYDTAFTYRADERGTTPALELAKERNRYGEASHYWNEYKTSSDLYESDHSAYYKPRFSAPRGGIDVARAEDRDFGDYEYTSTSQAKNYLYQFLHRNALKDRPSDRDDVRSGKFKWRYRDAVLEVGDVEATKMVKRAFNAVGKPTPSRYLPANLYDDMGTLFPEPVATAARYGRRSLRRRRHNPFTKVDGTDTLGGWLWTEPGQSVADAQREARERRAVRRTSRRSRPRSRRNPW